MTLSEYLDHAIVGDRIAVATTTSQSIGFLEAAGPALWVMAEQGPDVWLRFSDRSLNLLVRRVDRVPIGVPR